MKKDKKREHFRAHSLRLSSKSQKEGKLEANFLQKRKNKNPYKSLRKNKNALQNVSKPNVGT